MCFNHTYPCLSSPGYNLFISSQTLCPLIKFHLCSSCILSYVAFHWKMVPIPGTASLKETQSPCHYLVVAICSSAEFGSSTLFSRVGFVWFWAAQFLCMLSEILCASALLYQEQFPCNHNHICTYTLIFCPLFFSDP